MSQIQFKLSFNFWYRKQIVNILVEVLTAFARLVLFEKMAKTNSTKFYVMPS